MARTTSTATQMQSLESLPFEQRRLLGIDLCALLQIDVDALNVYDAVLAAVGDADIRRQVGVYRRDHERHVKDITACLDALGVPVPPAEPSALGMSLVMEISELSDEGDILMRFLLSEHLSSMKYSECVRNSGYVPESFARIAVEGASDETRHFNWALERLMEVPGMRPDLGPFLQLHEELEATLGDIRM